MRSETSSFVDRGVRVLGQKLLERVPSLERSLLTVRDRYARAWVRTRNLVNNVHYAAPPEPYRLLEIDPATIERGVQLRRPKFRETAVVTDGDWDRGDFVFDDLDVYRSYVAHFDRGVPWEETPFYDRVVEEIESGNPRWGCRTESAFRDRCQRLEQLYDRLQIDGYQSQSELCGGSPGGHTDDGVGEDPIDHQRRSELLTERMKDEIAVHIDRNGELLFVDGRNRLSMAKLIGLDRIVVHVLRRHSDWQAVRDAYVRGESWTRTHDHHPDIAALEFGSK